MPTITSVGPTTKNFDEGDVSHSSSGRVLSLTVASDGQRMYAGTYAGVWRSDDSGVNWRQMVRPQPGESDDPDVPGALYAPSVYDIAVSQSDPDLVLAACKNSPFSLSRNGVYRSTDGGNTWTRVQSGDVSEIVFAPDTPSLVYAVLSFAVAISNNAGASFSLFAVPASNLSHIAVGPLEGNGVRRVYAVTANSIFHSTDGGQHWRQDAGADTIASARQALSAFQIDCQIQNGSTNPSGLPSIAGVTSDNSGSGAHVLAIDPGAPARVFLAAQGGANGPSYYNSHNIPSDGTTCNSTCKRLAGEASLWLGDFSLFGQTGRANWVPLKGPGVYTGRTTPSGNCFVLTKATSTGFLLFFADNSHVHVSEGTPAGSHVWHRLDGVDISATHQAGKHENLLHMHPDPHALVVSQDFEITLKPPTGVSFPYDQNNILNKFIAGSIWMANDGGVYSSIDGGEHWKHASGLETLDPINITGIPRLGSPPALYMGCGDNDDFFSKDGGNTWHDPVSQCGDCDAWFADASMPHRVLEFVPLDGGMNIFSSDTSGTDFPDAGDDSARHFVPLPLFNNRPYAGSGVFLRGYRPIIQTLSGEQPLSDGDYVVLQKNPDKSIVLLRTTSISSIHTANDWNDTGKAQQIGPQLPPGADVVQAGGGHENPLFYIGGLAAQTVFRLDPASNSWLPIVPGPPKSPIAQRFFVDPFSPQLVFIVDNRDVKFTPDGGVNWITDVDLTRAVTMGGKLSINRNLITEMLFVRDEPTTCFVFGAAGIFCTVDGERWIPLLNSIALPGIPEFGFFDTTTRSLYIELSGRSVMRIDGVPPPPVRTSVFNLLEVAAALAAE